MLFFSKFPVDSLYAYAARSWPKKNVCSVLTHYSRMWKKRKKAELNVCVNVDVSSLFYMQIEDFSLNSNCG